MLISIIRRSLLFVSVALLIIPNIASSESNYPNKPVTIIVSFPPGGSSDFFTRLVANGLSEIWQETVIVENKPGGGGNIGAQAAARAKPDGYTLYMGSINTNAINPALYKNLSYDHIADFTPISKIATVPNVLVVNPELPVHSVSDLLSYIQNHPNLFYASPGAGTSPHLSTELFKTLAGVDMIHVPYKGSGLALLDVMAGRVPVAIDNMPAALAHIKAGKLRALAVTSSVRSPDLPDVPTMVEAGIADYDVTSWWGLFAPAQTSPNIIAKISSDVNKLLEDNSIKDKIQQQGATAAPSTPEQLEEFVKLETERWQKVVDKAKITIE